MTFTRSLVSSNLDKALFITWQTKRASYLRLTRKPLLRDVQLVKIAESSSKP
jgi:hypothetical protein